MRSLKIGAAFLGQRILHDLHELVADHAPLDRAGHDRHWWLGCWHFHRPYFPGVAGQIERGAKITG